MTYECSSVLDVLVRVSKRKNPGEGQREGEGERKILVVAFVIGAGC